MPSRSPARRRGSRRRSSIWPRSPTGKGQPNDKQWKSMVQKLLADRFKLAFHRDKKELSVYAITVAKNGPKLTKSESTEQPSRPVLPRAGKPAGDQRDHGGLCRGDAGRGARPAGGGPDRNYGKVGLHADLDAGRVSVWRRRGQDAAASGDEWRSASGFVYCHAGAAWVEAGIDKGPGGSFCDR